MAVLIRAVTMLVGGCGCVGWGAAGVGDRRLCQASGGWVRRSRVRSTGSLRLGTDRAHRRSCEWAPAVADLVVFSKVWFVSCWALADPDCLDAAMVVGGWDRMGESGMGDSGWGMVRVTLPGWGSGGAEFGRRSCGGNGCSPGGWAGWGSLQGGVLFAAFFSSRARA